MTSSPANSPNAAEAAAAPIIDRIRSAYPTTYLRHGECVDVAGLAGIKPHTLRKILESGRVTSRRFNGPGSRQHYLRDSLLEVLFGASPAQEGGGHE